MFKIDAICFFRQSILSAEIGSCLDDGDQNKAIKPPFPNWPYLQLRLIFLSLCAVTLVTNSNQRY